MHIFHLAIPSQDLEASITFYRDTMGATVGRSYSNYAVFDFFGHQLVTHLDPEGIDKNVKMYPRHFGIIVDSLENFESLYQRCKTNNAPFFQEKFERFISKPGWHHSFFISDPSNNLIEIKYYKNKKDILRPSH